MLGDFPHGTNENDEEDMKMMTLEMKAAKANSKEFDLNGYEVRNAIKVANRRNKIKTAAIESWFCGKKENELWQTVECHIMDMMTGERLDDVIINCCMFDRRKSFISKTIDEIK